MHLHMYITHRTLSHSMYGVKWACIYTCTLHTAHSVTQPRSKVGMHLHMYITHCTLSHSTYGVKWACIYTCTLHTMPDVLSHSTYGVKCMHLHTYSPHHTRHTWIIDHTEQSVCIYTSMLSMYLYRYAIHHTRQSFNIPSKVYAFIQVHFTGQDKHWVT